MNSIERHPDAPFGHERSEGIGRSHRSSVITPGRFMQEMEELLPSATQVDAIFMYSHAGEREPLERLRPSLMQAAHSAEGGVRLGFSKNHLKYVSLNPLKLHRIMQDRRQKAETSKQYEDLDGEENMDVFFTKSQGAGKRIHMRGRAGNVHSKFVQVRTEDKVITYMPEFNLIKSHLQMENSALRFEESLEDASRPNSVAGRVSEYMRKVREGDRFADYTALIDDDLEFIADSGKRRESLIQDRAVDLITDPSTKDIYFASQYPPFIGPTLNAIKQKAREGVPSFIFLPHDCLEGRYKRLNDIFLRRIKGLEDQIHVFYAPKTEENPKGGVHSRLLLVNSGLRVAQDQGTVVPLHPGENGTAIMTSNNLFPVGEVLGTGEAGFVIREQGLLEELGNVAVANLNNAIQQAA